MVQSVSSAASATTSNLNARHKLTEMAISFAGLLAAQRERYDAKATGTEVAGATASTTTGSGIDVSLQELSGPAFIGPKDIASFGQDLTRRMERAGIDTDRPIALKVGTDGHVTAGEGDQDKDKIDALFANDPDLENQFRGVSSALTMKALARADKVYVEAYDNAKDDKEREDVWRKHMAQVSQIMQSSGQMTLSGGLVTSPGLDMMGGSSLLG